MKRGLIALVAIIGIGISGCDSAAGPTDQGSASSPVIVGATVPVSGFSASVGPQTGLPGAGYSYYRVDGITASTSYTITISGADSILSASAFGNSLFDPAGTGGGLLCLANNVLGGTTITCNTGGSQTSTSIWFTILNASVVGDEFTIDIN